MAASMYAVVGSWTMETGRWEEQLQGLHEHIVPRARQIPGFVAGYWLGDPQTGRSQSLIVLEDEASARAFESFVRANPLNREQAGVEMESLTVAPVMAEAHR